MTGFVTRDSCPGPPGSGQRAARSHLRTTQLSESSPLVARRTCVSEAVSSEVTSPRERIAALDGLRGAMAWAVALYHLGVSTHAFVAGSTLASVIAVLGLHSVGGFFVVSGFCLFHLHGGMQLRAPELRRFYLQRFARIAPLFYLVLAVDLLLHRPAAPLSWQTLLENLTFTFGLHHPNYALVTGGWSIGLEMLFYASFPVLAWVFRSSVGLAVTTLASIALAWSHGANVVEPAADAARFNAYVALQNHAFAFLLGGWIAKLAPLVRVHLRLPNAIALLGFGVAAWIASGPRVIDHFDVVLGAQRAGYVAAAMACVALAVCTEVSSTPARRWLEALGELSYPVYLLHPVIWVVCSAWLPASTRPVVALLVALGGTAVVSLIAARLYERPIRRRLTARTRRLDRSGAAPAFAVDSAPHGPVF